MVKVYKWFEREFRLGLPVWMFPNVIERLRGTPTRLEDRLRLLPAEMLTRRTGEAWSIQEHAGHLHDLGTLDMGRLDDYEAGAEVLRAADLDNRKTFEAGHNTRRLDDLLAEFRAERTEFVRRLEELDAEFVARTALHPRLKIGMQVVDFAFFVAEHDDHHLARITGLVREFTTQSSATQELRA